MSHSDAPVYPFPTFTKSLHHSVYPSIDPKNPTLSAAGKVVLITGGGRGIGKFIATSFAGAGARVIILLGRTASSLASAEQDIITTATAAGHTSLLTRSFAVDIRDTNAIAEAFRTIEQTIGAIDLFINNAGDFYPSAIATASISDFWSSFEINVLGTQNCLQAFLRQHSLDAGDASSDNMATVINISTIGIHMPAHGPFACYAASKLAAWKLMEYAAFEVGDKVRVFSIHPGMVATEMSALAGVPVFDDQGML
jgi:NAD(P)-dependent dehydrogenase (short-subunit alcohol dehydrogenase family)